MSKLNKYNIHARIIAIIFIVFMLLMFFIGKKVLHIPHEFYNEKYGIVR